MQYRLLGKTGIRISVISFGAGPVPALLTRADDADAQRATVRCALEAGINWFDTAATYGEGRSEMALGQVLRDLAAEEAHIATKVRVPAERLGDIRAFVRESIAESLKRLSRSKVTLVQLHNSITARRGDQPTSITPGDVLGPGGVLEAFRGLREEGLVDHLGLTGLGDPAALREVVRSGGFETIQAPYHLLNPTAGADLAPPGIEADYGHIFYDCAEMGMGILAIRVFAGGALIGQPPGEHTSTTKFFPLAVYERDLRRAADLVDRLSLPLTLHELAVRFALSHRQVTSALIGFSSPGQIGAAIAAADRGALEADMLDQLDRGIRSEAAHLHKFPLPKAEVRRQEASRATDS